MKFKHSPREVSICREMLGRMNYENAVTLSQEILISSLRIPVPLNAFSICGLHVVGFQIKLNITSTQKVRIWDVPSSAQDMNLLLGEKAFFPLQIPAKVLKSSKQFENIFEKKKLFS